MKKKVTIVLALFLITTFLHYCGDDNASNPKVTEIKGIIVDEMSNKAISNAFIKTEPPSGSVNSNSSGEYSIQNLITGNYTVIVEKSGYYTKRVTVNVVEGNITTANIPMKSVKDNNNYPNTPVIDYPYDGGDVNPGDFYVEWTCSDPDNDDLTYTIYLGKNSTSLPLLIDNIKINKYKITGLEDSTKFYLKIIATDIWGASTESETIIFTTFNKLVNDIPHTGLIAYYPFSGNAEDKGPNKLNGTIFYASNADDRFGNKSSSLYFNGKNSYVDIPYTSLFNLENDYSISLWLKPDYDFGTDYQGHIDIVSRCSKTWGGYYLGITTDSYLEYWTSYSIMGLNNIYSNNKIISNKWCHIVLRYNETTEGSGSIDIFIDGVLNNSALIHNPANLSDIHLRIGGRNTGQNFFAGYIDDVIFYNRALSNQEISKLAAY